MPEETIVVKIKTLERAVNQLSKYASSLVQKENDALTKEERQAYATMRRDVDLSVSILGYRLAEYENQTESIMKQPCSLAWGTDTCKIHNSLIFGPVCEAVRNYNAQKTG